MKFLNECWALVPARSGSQTIKHKNIMMLNKKPLIYYSLDLAKKCKFFKKIIFSSDSTKYLKLASKFGNFYLHKRDYASSTHTATDLDVFKSFIRDHLKDNYSLPKYFAHLRPTTPVRNIKTINKILRRSLQLAIITAPKPIFVSQLNIYHHGMNPPKITEAKPHFIACFLISSSSAAIISS